MIVRSFGGLQSYEAGAPFAEPRTVSYTSTAPAGTWTLDLDQYGAMYRTQPAVRTCVDFLARNIAQLGLHVFRRVSDTDRERLADHQLARWLAAPNPGTTRYRLFESTMQDLGIYFAAYWLKVRRTDGELGLVRLPPPSVAVDGWLLPKLFVWTLPSGETMELEAGQVVYFSGYNPDSPVEGLSPLETLRQRLAEEAAANTYREQFWDNAARLEGVIERPAGAPKWTPDQKASFREQWTERYIGHPGQTAVLDEGMTWKSVTANAQESEYINARKLTRAEVASAYHIPHPMVGILDHATFSNIKEQHKQLYQDCLGPWLVMLEEELARQLLIECRDRTNVYPEFNIAEKLKGSFEEQAVALQRTVGRPIMTANEGRARLNLPAITDDPTADALAMPLNSTAAAQARPTDPANADPGDGTAPGLDAAHLVPVLRATLARQWAKLERVPVADRAEAFDVLRWDRELAADLLPLYLAGGEDLDTAMLHSAALAERVNADTMRRLITGAPYPFSDREADYA